MLSSSIWNWAVSPISNGANDVDLTLRGLNGGSFENRLVLDSDGDVAVCQANLVIWHICKGIDFSATADTNTSLVFKQNSLIITKKVHGHLQHL